MHCLAIQSLHKMVSRNPYSSSLKWLLPPLLLASTVVSHDGPFTVSPMPSICTASTITYSSSLVMPTGSFDIDPGTYSMGNPGQKWNFTVDSGMNLSSWGDDGQRISKWIVRNSAAPYSLSNSTLQNGSVSYTFTVPTDGSWRKPFVSCMARTY